MRLTPKIVLEIMAHEAIVRQAYKDSVGVWTWSVGITNASGHNVTRYIGNPQSMERCLAVFLWLLEEKYAPAVHKAFKGHVLSEEQFGAALSFHWNTGAIARASWVKAWKKNKSAEAYHAFLNWRKPPEIVPRRLKERDLFFAEEWSHQGFLVNEITRVTSSSAPDFRSMVKIDIQDDLLAAMAGHSPGAPPDVPTDTEVPVRPSFWAGLIMRLLRAIRSLF